MRVEFDSEASNELFAAHFWYLERSRNAAQRFKDAVEFAVLAILAAPERFPNARHGCRRCMLKRFPYAVVFKKLTAEIIVVVAVAHVRRRPGYWRTRLQ